MKILIYIEPHPVRDIKQFFTTARNYFPLLSLTPEFDVRMFANKPTLDSVLQEVDGAIKDKLLWPTDDESKMISAYDNSWQLEDVERWKDLITGHGLVSEKYYDVICRLWSLFPFDTIIHWGGNGAIDKFVQRYSVEKISMELGCTRGPYLKSIVMDPYGSNGAGLVGKLSSSEIVEAVGTESVSRDKSLFGYSASVEAKGYEERFSSLPEYLNDEFRKNKLVFFPLQLFDDANLLIYSKYNTLVELVLDVVPSLAERGYKIIVKPHPSSRHRKGADMANSLARAALSPWTSNVIWEDGPDAIPNSRYFSIADFVVTVNSSVGFEALYYGKPVVVLGDAVYKPKDLFPSLKDMLEDRFDGSAYSRNIAALRTFMLGSYLLPLDSFNRPHAFLDRVALIKRLYRRHHINPSVFARKLFDSTCYSRMELVDSGVIGGHTSPKIYQIKNAWEADGAIDCLDVQTGSSSRMEKLRAIVESSIRRSFDYKIRDYDTFSSWMNEIWSDRQLRSQFILDSRLVDPEYYLQQYPDIRAANIDPALHYSTQGILECRSPRSCIGAFNDQEVLELLLEAGREQYAYLEKRGLSDRSLRDRKMHLTSIREALGASTNRLLVVAHMFYRNHVSEILNSLHYINEGFDLIVTTPDWGYKDIATSVKAQFPDAVFYHAPNRGRDIAPFLDVLPIVLEKDYDAALKIQTKNGYYTSGILNPKFGQIWREEALDSLLGSPSRVSQIVDLIRSCDKLNLVGPQPVLQSLDRYPYHDDGELAKSLSCDDVAGRFFAGTMFWFRPECFKDLVKLDIRDFEPENGGNDGGLAHLIERIFGHMAMNSGGVIAAAPVDPAQPIVMDSVASAVSIHDYLAAQDKLKRSRELLSPAAGRQAFG